MVSAERYATTISIVYFSVYIAVFLIASIFCAYEVEQQHNLIRTHSRKQSTTSGKEASSKINPSSETKGQIEFTLTNTDQPTHEGLEEKSWEKQSQFQQEEINENDLAEEKYGQAEDSDVKNNKNKSCFKIFKTFTKYWLKSLWTKKKIYISIVPHIFDQATDAGVIYTYYEIWSNPDQYKNENQS